MKRLALALLLLPCPLLAATYYVDFDGGNDANAGTSTAAPWKHHPGMEPFAGSYTHADGDRIILKGGVTWPNSVLPVLIEDGGASGNPDYHGVDLAWYSGGSWTRPLLDAGGVAMTNWASETPRDNVVYLKSSSGSADWGILDNWEIAGHIWRNISTTSESDSFGVGLWATDNWIIQNCLIRDWVVQTTRDSKFGGVGAFNGSTANIVSNCVIRAPAVVAPEYKFNGDSGNSSGAGVTGIGTVYDTVIEGTTQGLFGVNTIRGNRVINLSKSFGTDNTDSSPAHGNGLWMQSGGNAWNNVWSNCVSGVGVYLYGDRGNNGGTRITRFYNNVVQRSHQVTILNEGASEAATQEMWVVNNIFAQGGGSVNLGSTKSGPPFDVFVYRNNLHVSDSLTSASPTNTWVTILDLAELGTSHTNANHVYLGATEAEVFGATHENYFFPTAEWAEIEGTGYNFSDLFTTDRLGVTRPSTGAWDIGAHRISDEELPPPAGPTLDYPLRSLPAGLGLGLP